MSFLLQFFNSIISPAPPLKQQFTFLILYFHIQNHNIVVSSKQQRLLSVLLPIASSLHLALSNAHFPMLVFS